MGRRATRTKEDILKYGRNYYANTKDDRKNEYNLVSKRSYYRNKLKNETDEVKIAKYQSIIVTTQNELDAIRAARWKAKQNSGKGQYKKVVINENPNTIQ